MFLLFILLAILKNAACDTFYIVPNAGGTNSCPVSAGRCYTLQEYASSPIFTSNLTLQLLPGNHSLNTTLSLTASVVNFTVVSNNGAIICGRAPNRGSITFEGVQTVRIGQLSFVDCYTRVRNANNLILEDNIYQGGDSVGFQVSDNGYAHFRRVSFISVRGSAMAISGSTVNIESCNFIGNGHPLRHGGAIVSTQSRTLTVINSTFIENSAGVEGGGVYSMSSRVDISGCNFTRNVARQSGGAVSIRGSGGSILNSHFIENTAGEVRSGSGTGGAVLNQAVFDSTALEIHHSSFVSNAAGNNGGAVFIRTRRHFDVTNSIFRNNSAFQGGAIDLYKNHHVIILSVINCTFSNNSAVLKPIHSNTRNSRGGAVQIRGGIRCVGSNFTNNSAFYYGGVAYMYDDSNDFYSENCIFTNNSASTGSGGVLYGFRRETTALIVDSTFTRNSAPLCGVADMLSITDSYHNNLTVISSLFMHNSATDNTSDVVGLGGVGCIKDGSMTITCSTFIDNAAAHIAGVFYANKSDLTISQSLFSRNFAAYDGGVMYTNHSSHYISDSSFNSNSAENNGGTLFIRDSEANGRGTVHNCQFRQNSAGEGGALFITSTMLAVSQTNFLGNTAATAGGIASSCSSRVTIDGDAGLQTTTDSICTSFDGDITHFNVTITFDCPFGEPDDPSTTAPPEVISFPITYDITSIRQRAGSDGACPVEQLRQETQESILNNVREIVQNSVVPLLTSNEPRNR